MHKEWHWLELLIESDILWEGSTLAIVKELPKTSVGKVDKKQVRKIIAEMLGVKVAINDWNYYSFIPYSSSHFKTIHQNKKDGI